MNPFLWFAAKVVLTVILIILLNELIIFLKNRNDKQLIKNDHCQREDTDTQIVKSGLKIFNDEDLKILSHCYYDSMLQQFNFCKLRQVYNKYYIEQAFYYEFEHNIKDFTKYQKVYVDFLPRNAQSIKVRFSNVCDKKYDTDPYIDTIQYPCQHTIYLKFNDKEIKLNDFDEDKCGIISVYHIEAHNSFNQNMYTNANFHKYFEFRIEITNETNKKEEELIIEKQKLFRFQKIDVKTKRLKIDILSFTVS